MTIHYAIRPANPSAHLFHVVCRVERPDPAGQLFMLPAWIPGSYMIREFARHIVRISALSADRKVRIAKLDKDGRFIKHWGSTGSEPGQFKGLKAIAIDAKGLVYVADAGNKRIQVFDGDGAFKS